MQLKSQNIDKIYYISPRDIRKNRADAVHIMYSCAAFSNNGIKVELLAPKVKRDNYKTKNNDIFSLYDVPKNFTITELKTRINEVNNKSSFLTLTLNKFIFHLIFILQNISKLKNKKTIIYSKCYISTLPYILIKKTGLIKCKLVFETPFLKNNAFHKFIIKKMDAVVTMTKYVENILKDEFNISLKKIILCPIRFQTDYHVKKINKENAKKQLKWSSKKTYIVYAGKTGTTRTDVFIESSRVFKKIMFVIVGATKDLEKKYDKKIYKNLKMYPFQTYTNYLKYVHAADILVASYEDNIYNRHTLSPGKGGAYLQSGNPVVFPDLPCLRERFPKNIVS